MRKMTCAALVLAVCSVAQGADDWRERFDKYHEAEKVRAKEEAKKWSGKLADKEADLATAKRGKTFDQMERAITLQSTVNEYRAELKRATDYAKSLEVKDWKPTKAAFRAMHDGHFAYRVNAPVKVLQLTDGGAIVQWATETTSGVPDGQRYFLKGLPEAAEGKTYKVTGYIERTGAAKYTSTAGDERTVAALQLHGK
jgi:hypothetical protein